MNDKEVQKSANNIAILNWSEEKNIFDVLYLLCEKHLIYKGKKISVHILDMKKEQKFLELFSPVEYSYSSDQQYLCFYNKYLNEYMIIIDDFLTKNNNELRFTLSFILGYIFMGEIDEKNYIWNIRNYKSSKNENEIQSKANLFACELLVPFDKLSEYLSTSLNRTVKESAETFKVSITVMNMILKNFNNRGGI